MFTESRKKEGVRMVEGGMKCVKYILIVCNLIFFLFGLLLIIAGALTQTMLTEYFAFFGAKINVATILIIVVGVIIFTVGFFGCCGAYKENYCMIMTFAVLLGVVLALEIAAAVAAQLKGQELETLVKETMNSAIYTYQKQTFHDAWDGAQKKLECCGSTNYTDWSMNRNLSTTSSAPDSCCINVVKDCGKESLKENAQYFKLHKQGCADKLISLAKNNFVIIVGAVVTLAVVQVLDIVLAVLLNRAIKNDIDVV